MLASSSRSSSSIMVLYIWHPQKKELLHSMRMSARERRTLNNMYNKYTNTLVRCPFGLVFPFFSTQSRIMRTCELIHTFIQVNNQSKPVVRAFNKVANFRSFLSQKAYRMYKTIKVNLDWIFFSNFFQKRAQKKKN